MKKIILLLIFGLFPISVYAFDFTCDNGNYSYEDKIVCQITDNQVNNYESITGTIPSSEFISCELASTDSSLIGEVKNNKLSYKGQNTTGVLFTFNCVVSKNIEKNQKTNLVIEDFEYQIKNNKLNNQILRSNFISLNTKESINNSKPRNTKNPDVRLKSISDPNLDFTFSGFITEYNIEVLNNVENLYLNVIPLNEEANVNIVGSSSLKEGLNVIDIYVVSPDNSTKNCYTLNITRLKPGEAIYYEENDADLKDLKVVGYAISFKEDKFDYVLKLDPSVKEVKVRAQSKADGAIITIKNDTNLINGSVVQINVKSPNGLKEQNYSIKIIKEQKKDYKNIIILGTIIVAVLAILIVIIISLKSIKK